MKDCGECGKLPTWHAPTCSQVMTAPDKPLHERMLAMADFLGEGHIAALLREAAEALRNAEKSQRVVDAAVDAYDGRCTITDHNLLNAIRTYVGGRMPRD